MTGNVNMVAEVAAIAGDPARTGMLLALMGGRALTASELAAIAGVTPQTASGHLSRMIESGLVAVTKQGRHRYHRLASGTVARMIETLMQVAIELQPPARAIVLGPRDQALRAARTCYDHLAGRLGVAIAEGMTAQGHAEIDGEAGLITESGLAFLDRLGIDLDALRQRRPGRVLCRPCLDWSERRPHLAGAVGAALCRHALAAGWVRRLAGTRAVAVTPEGARIFRESFGVTS